MKVAAALERLEQRARAVPWRIRGRNPVSLTLDSVRRFVDVRVTGLAAEMTYYTILSLVPLATALGASFGVVERFIGADRVDDLESTLIDSLESFFSAQVVEDVAGPLVEDLLRQQRTGLAIGSLALSLYLASRVFRAAIRALDDAYDVPERRNIAEQFGLAVAFLLGSLVVVVLSLAVLVLGPLLGVGSWIAERVGAGSLAELIWGWGRWPVVAAVAFWFLVSLYRSGPNVENTWRECVPGAVVSLLSLVAVVVGFQVYLSLAAPTVPDVGDADEAVRLAGQLAGVALAALLFMWLLNIAVLVGGVVNAEWRRQRPK
jgi:membrane protein